MAAMPTFKQKPHPYPPGYRPSSPSSPAFEPLSPPRPIEPVYNYRAIPGTQSQPWLQKRPLLTVLEQKTPYESDARGGEHKRKHGRSPSTIEELADVALSTSPQQQHQQPQHPASYLRKTSLGQSNHHYMPSQYAVPPAPTVPASASDEPVAKRSRSDTGPLPYPSYPARPSTSHQGGGWDYALEQANDRARRQSTNTTTSNPLEDAELLLNFASRVQPRAAPDTSDRRRSSLAPPALAVSPRAIAQPLVSESAEVPPAPTSAPQLPQAPEEDASASLPSPQGTNTNEEDKMLGIQVATHSSDKMVGAEPETEIKQSPSGPAPTTEEAPAQLESGPQQTQTPPEDEQRPVLLDVPSEVLSEPTPTVTEEGPSQPPIKEDAAVAETSLGEPQSTDSPAPRPRRGWPKGKPRGPRNKSSGNKPRTATKRSRTSKTSIDNSGASSSEESSAPIIARRKSETDLAALFAMQSDSRTTAAQRHYSVPPNLRYEILPPRAKTPGRKPGMKKVTQDTICKGCKESRESNHGEMDQWIGCNGCKEWFHSDCAGFENERDVRDVDKFFCEACEPKHGKTTFVRKSSRTHTNVDYAGLNQGILKTSDEDPEHHYVQPIKDGFYTFEPENFPRMPPELVTADYFQTCANFTEPVLIPAALNPSPQLQTPAEDDGGDVVMRDADAPELYDVSLKQEQQAPGGDEESLDEHDMSHMTRYLEYETVLDDGQDKLDMVIPRGLTVRNVAKIVGYDEPLEVIDVKTQGTEGKWNLGKFADYYESEGDKPVRNVISLEVSHTKLGKLLRRPKVVRDLDLQDSVWPQEEAAKGNYPKVQFYCLMSVADSFTDFHIDFGGSSVYYHILKGRKTFFFIPPKPSNLKAYEDWNNSPEQNFTWLPTKSTECFRVDLYPGDTMLIPSGWIHAVWTPSNSLVIGGNFLTRLHYSMQFRVVDIEKANKTPLKFRYPQFQKVMWYAVIKYLGTDPLPREVATAFHMGERFSRDRPIWEEYDGDDEAAQHLKGSPHHNARYYSQAELDGLPELVKFIFRTVMIAAGRVDGVTEETRKKVVRSIPKTFGEPLELARTFALWVAWKRGNEDPPAWAHPDATLPDRETTAPKKLGTRAMKQLERQEAFELYKAAPDRVSARQLEKEKARSMANSVSASSPAPSTNALQPSPQPQLQQLQSQPPSLAQAVPQATLQAVPRTQAPPPQQFSPQGPLQQMASFPPHMSTSPHLSTPKTSVLGPKRVACDACRKRRIRCKHKDEVQTVTPQTMPSLTQSSSSFGYSGNMSEPQPESQQLFGIMDNTQPLPKLEYQVPTTGIAPIAPMMATDGGGPALVPGNALLADSSSKRGRSKACLDCRKSKRRCVHDENGRIDPVKAEQAPVPRGTGIKKRRISGEDETPSKKVKQIRAPHAEMASMMGQMAPQTSYQAASPYPQNEATTPEYPQQTPSYPEPSASQWQQQQSSYMYPDPPGSDHVGTNNGPYHQQPDNQNPYSAQTLEQLANEVLDSRYVNADEDGGYTMPHPSVETDGSQPPPLPVVGYHTQHRVSASQHRLQQSLNSVHNDVAFAGLPNASAAKHARDAVNGASSSEKRPEPAAVNAPEPQKDTIEQNRVEKTPAQSTTTVAKENQHKDKNVFAQTNSDHVETTVPDFPVADLSSIPLYQPPPPIAQRDAKRRMSGSKTPAPMAAPDFHSPGSARKSARDGQSATPSKSKMRAHAAEAGRASSVATSEDEESLRLAKELQGQEWGLRRRSIAQ